MERDFPCIVLYKSVREYMNRATWQKKNYNQRITNYIASDIF